VCSGIRCTLPPYCLKCLPQTLELSQSRQVVSRAGSPVSSYVASASNDRHSGHAGADHRQISPRLSRGWRGRSQTYKCPHRCRCDAVPSIPSSGTRLRRLYSASAARFTSSHAKRSLRSCMRQLAGMAPTSARMRTDASYMWPIAVAWRTASWTPPYMPAACMRTLCSVSKPLNILASADKFAARSCRSTVTPAGNRVGIRALIQSHDGVAAAARRFPQPGSAQVRSRSKVSHVCTNRSQRPPKLSRQSTACRSSNDRDALVAHVLRRWPVTISATLGCGALMGALWSDHGSDRLRQAGLRYACNLRSCFFPALCSLLRSRRLAA